MSEDYNPELEVGTEIPRDNSQPAPEAPVSESDSKDAAPQSAAPEQKEPPFHEHPRFKEVIEQKNQALQAVKDMQRQMQEFQAKLAAQPQAPSKASSEQEEFLKTLEGVNPAWAKFLKDQYEASLQNKQLSEKIAQLEQQHQASQREALRVAAVSEVVKMHDSNKISPELRDLYNAQLDARATAGQLNTLEDVRKAYGEIHNTYNKVFENLRKAERESYVAGKKSDSSVPSSQPKGAAKPGTAKPAFQYSSDPEERKAQMVQRVLKATRESGKL